MVGVLLQHVLSHVPGEDGPSQMALEDLAMFRAVPMSTVFYPSDGVSTEKAVELAANTKVGHMLFLFSAERGVGGGQRGQPAGTVLAVHCPRVVCPDLPLVSVACRS